MALDIVIHHLIAAALAIVFLLGAWQKLHDIEAFSSAVENYELLPQRLIAWVSWTLPVFEIVAALMLVSTPTRTFGAVVALAVLLTVTAAIVVNLARGRRDVGCGCGGLEDEQTLSWALVARNACLLAAAALLFTPTEARDLVALDHLTVAGGTIALFGLYTAASQLIANLPRLGRLRFAR